MNVGARGHESKSYSTINNAIPCLIVRRFRTLFLMVLRFVCTDVYFPIFARQTFPMTRPIKRAARARVRELFEKRGVTTLANDVTLEVACGFIAISAFISYTLASSVALGPFLTSESSVDSVEFWSIIGPQIFGLLACFFLIRTVLELARSGYKAVFVCFVQVGLRDPFVGPIFLSPPSTRFALSSSVASSDPKERLNVVQRRQHGVLAMAAALLLSQKVAAKRVIWTESLHQTAVSLLSRPTSRIGKTMLVRG